MKKTANIRSVAVKYILADGFSVIPVGKNKKPLLPHWKPFQTRQPTEEEISGWFEKYPHANVGIVTGQISGITVVDIDTHKGGDPAPFPPTYTVRTGNGGLQLYYKYHKGFSISANAYEKFPHVDIRSDGGYVVAPPSVITPTVQGATGEYSVERPGDFADFPAHLFDAKKTKKIADLIEVPKNHRNSSLASLIGSLVYGRPKKKMAEVYPAVVAINKTYVPPLPIKELDTTFKSIVDRELKRQNDIEDAVPSPFQLKEGAQIDLALRKNGNGAVYKDMANALIVLRSHPATKGRIRYNEFARDIEWNDGENVRALEETDIIHLVHLMQTEIKMAGMTKDIVYDAIRYYAYENRYDEAKEWLRNVKWDGTKRLSAWLSASTGAPDDAYHAAIGSHWFCGMVRRLVYPGSIFDYVLVLVGPQGIGKTSLFRIIGGPWYKSYTGAVENKDFYIALRGACVVDLDEGVALYKSESIKIKSIITEVSDEFRAPYDRTTKCYPRRFVFSMSTNDTEPFRDVTGNRRYWVVDLGKRVNFKWLEENRDQLFAEAYYAVMNGVKLPDVPFDVAERKQEEHLPSDEWTESIEAYLRKSADYCSGSERFEVSIGEIYDKVLKGDRLERLERRHEMRIGNILRRDLKLVRMRRFSFGYRYVLSEEERNRRTGSPLAPFIEDFDREAEEIIHQAKL